MTRSAAHPIDELLRHEGFLRELARELCGDGARADDLAQDVWLASLKSPPRDGASPRGWLATIARRLASNARRADRRRTAREIDQARELRAASVAPSPPEVLAREQLRERVVRAVLALDEPFREAMLLRFYEGLEPREIAERLGIPAATVRTRVARGLEKLRVQLDAAHAGDRPQWLLALAPILRAPRPPAAGLVPVLAMKKLAVPLIALALAVVTLRVVWPPESATGTGHDAEGSAVSTARTDIAADVDASGSDPLSSRSLIEAGASAPVDVRGFSNRFPADRLTGAVFGQVVDGDGAPVAAALVVATPDAGPMPPGLMIEDDRTGRHEAQSDAALPIQVEELHSIGDLRGRDHNVCTRGKGGVCSRAGERAH